MTQPFAASTKRSVPCIIVKTFAKQRRVCAALRVFPKVACTAAHNVWHDMCIHDQHCSTLNDSSEQAGQSRQAHKSPQQLTQWMHVDM
jgi:hypothetical protein